MNQKSKSLLIAGFAILLFVVVTILFLSLPLKNKLVRESARTVQEPDGSLPELVCNYADDQAAYADAVTTQSVNQCACITDESLQSTCKATAMDVMFYTNALSHLDEKMCDKINDSEQKNACVSVVKDSIMQLKEKDPQYLADVYANTHNEQAIDAFEQLIQKDQNNIDAYTALALAYAEKGLREQEQGNDQMPYVQKALSTIEKAKALDQNNAEVYRVEAYANEIKPDYGMALALYDKAIEIDSNNVLAYAGRGHTNRMLGILDQAVSDFTKAAQLDTQKTHIHIYTNLCNLEYSRSHNEDAIKNCKIVTQSENADPTFRSGAYQTMALIFMNTKDFVQAKNYLLTAKTLTPQDPNLYVTLAKLNIFEKNYIESEVNARKAIEMSPTKAMGYLALSHAFYLQEKYDVAIQAAQKGITLVKNDVSLLAPDKPATLRDLNYAIANSYRQMGDTQKQQEYEKKGNDAFTNPIN